ncbi:MAG: SufD family Fe-S cluster assembly protein [Candidatus Sungbacteria bacterium]|nr:SufD family Fe-S cluster assembly protein [Candidatus Sungbacteria bacterium]
MVLVDRMPEKIQLQVRLAGRGCRAEITVAHIGKKAQETNMDITLIHDAPDTYGRVVVKSALFDQSKFVFRGMLEITENGKGSDSYLLAKALMVSPQARAEIYPYLEIKTDEVRASHGSSVGKIDPGQLFYLASRGVSKLEAEKVILAGFFGDSNEFLPAALSSTNG